MEHILGILLIGGVKEKRVLKSCDDTKKHAVMSHKPFEIQTKFVENSNRNLYPPCLSVLFPVTLSDP